MVYIPATFNAEEGLRKGMATTDKNKGGIPDWGEWPVVWGGVVIAGATAAVQTLAVHWSGSNELPTACTPRVQY